MAALVTILYKDSSWIWPRESLSLRDDVATSMQGWSSPVKGEGDFEFQQIMIQYVFFSKLHYECMKDVFNEIIIDHCRDLNWDKCTAVYTQYIWSQI